MTKKRAREEIKEQKGEKKDCSCVWMCEAKRMKENEQDNRRKKSEQARGTGRNGDEGRRRGAGGRKKDRDESRGKE